MEYKKIAKEILEMAERDQEFRLSIDAKNITDEEMEKMRKMDKAHTGRLKEIIGEIGWPTISKVGEEASHAAWLLVQHCPDPDFQKQALEMMKNKEEDVDRQNIAYLEDRILANDGKPQLYGTQHELKGGKWVPKPIKDEQDVDKRRKEMGMETLKENTARLNRGPQNSLKQ